MTKRKTYIANAIEAAGDKARYDAEVKKILSDRHILAWILKKSVSEFQDCSIEEIVASIEEPPKIGSVPVIPGGTNAEYSMSPKHLYGNFTGSARYDLLSVLMICLGKEEKSGANELHRLLGTVLSNVLSVGEKEEILEKEYHIPMTRELKEGFGAMCNLSDLIEEKGIEQGIEQGVEQGIKAMVLDNINSGFSRSQITDKLEKWFSLSSEAAEAYFEKYEKRFPQA